ncbi:matrix metalloproteinase-25 [Onychomys torridus]|uniref:matrix metalloproteinase-25 n=1 Tax=Onychomys torridus TaxID=38674 RepID=UPI00167FCD73|nr:matrix metalloproteinase-25 [Onychomys torridus]
MAPVHLWRQVVADGATLQQPQGLAPDGKHLNLPILQPGPPWTNKGSFVPALWCHKPPSDSSCCSLRPLTTWALILECRFRPPISLGLGTGPAQGEVTGCVSQRTTAAATSVFPNHAKSLVVPPSAPPQALTCRHWAPSEVPLIPEVLFRRRRQVQACTDGEGTDLFAVAVHEFGHALGLGHSSAPNSIMRPFYQGPVGDPDKYRLSQDDRDGLQQLYGKVSHTPYDKPTRKPLASPPQPPALPPDSPSTPVPDRCEGNFDAIANIRGEIFFFKGPWFWRLQPSGQLVSPRPARLHRFWEGLPTHVRIIQAAYARPRDGRIILFSGPQFWVFQDRLLEGAARPLVEFGLPPGEEVDAVFSWPLNGKTYLIRGQQYWRYDEEAARLDPGYPRALSLWEGAPPSPDDVTISNTGDTYFFKGTYFWRFAKGSVKSEPDSPQPMGPKWLDCPAPNSDPQIPNSPKTTPKTGTCDCHCELNQASEQLLVTFPLPLLLLLAGAVLSS